MNADRDSAPCQYYCQVRFSISLRCERVSDVALTGSFEAELFIATQLFLQFFGLDTSPKGEGVVGGGFSANAK